MIFSSLADRAVAANRPEHNYDSASALQPIPNPPLVIHPVDFRRTGERDSRQHEFEICVASRFFFDRIRDQDFVAFRSILDVMLIRLRVFAVALLSSIVRWLQKWSHFSRMA